MAYTNNCLCRMYTETAGGYIDTSNHAPSKTPNTYQMRPSDRYIVFIDSPMPNVY